jgi:hypothetical protein
MASSAWAQQAPMLRERYGSLLLPSPEDAPRTELNPDWRRAAKDMCARRRSRSLPADLGYPISLSRHVSPSMLPQHNTALPLWPAPVVPCYDGNPFVGPGLVACMPLPLLFPMPFGSQWVEPHSMDRESPPRRFIGQKRARLQ